MTQLKPPTPNTITSPPTSHTVPHVTFTHSPVSPPAQAPPPGHTSHNNASLLKQNHTHFKNIMSPAPTSMYDGQPHRQFFGPDPMGSTTSLSQQHNLFRTDLLSDTNISIISERSSKLRYVCVLVCATLFLTTTKNRGGGATYSPQWSNWEDVHRPSLF